MEGGAGGGNVVDEPEMFAGEVRIGAAGKGAQEVVEAIGAGVDFGLFGGSTDAAERGSDFPVGKRRSLTGEFFGLIETAAGAAGPKRKRKSSKWRPWPAFRLRSVPAKCLDCWGRTAPARLPPSPS